MTWALQFQGVHKYYGNQHVLRGLDLLVPERSVFAFLGNNGEGKSTAIRLLLGLAKMDRGEIRLFGSAVQKNKTESLRDVGCLVDSPSAYPNLNAREFLEIARCIKDLPKSEIDRVLNLVGMKYAERVLIGKYSLGMKQRLALGHALMGQPKLLVLDEPTNGLDPSGIQEIRSLIQSLPEQTGTTVFVSSHQLDEVEKVATHMALLRGGVAQFSSSLDQFRRASKADLVIETSQGQQAFDVLRELGCEVTKVSETRVRVKKLMNYESWQLHQFLVNAGVRLQTSYFESVSLEQWFTQQMKTKQTEAI
ncbi:ATP-binding cassette domain-containing protein [Undibacterium cyanobacteriorum]|uniref:ATP-binding cassette domain-containing protein n=1 Tax=Undibacterium cyanobacteriorum TaxID=3073561 RepID=A0ABY9RR20_9BURK|nr:ATP-binding cassette domain-containing protein [Undibacterium sp. 20NA77.5]WMW82391.1 ATP-binding cassette domain-containing protein [Undibacterium sp. 20NA77.5]